jgi:hypothetical protein
MDYGQFPSPYANNDYNGQHSDGHRANRARFADIFESGLFHWEKKKQLSPGAMAYAFETLALAEFTPIGPSVASRHLFQTVQPPQLYVNNMVVNTTGLGGLYAGQYISQPLLDPSTNSYGGTPIP